MGDVTPCIKQCKLVNGLCRGCLRTLDEIRTWREKNMTERMEVIAKVRGQLSTHDCPVCTGPAYCAMEDGKSASSCWCMDVKDVRMTLESVDMYGACLCRRCLVNGIGGGV